MKKKEINLALSEDLIRTKIRVNEAQAEKIELKNAQTRRELITMEEVNAQWTENVANVKAKLLAIPMKLTPQLSDVVLQSKVVYEILETAIKEALMELSEGYKQDEKVENR